MYCPKCRSRLYPDDQKYMEVTGVCGNCVHWDDTPNQRYKTAWANHLEMQSAVTKRYKDGMGTAVDLLSKSIGLFTDDRGKTWRVYKPISNAWHGLYHLEPLNGGRPKYIIIGLSTCLPPEGEDWNSDGDVSAWWEKQLTRE